MHLIAVFAVLLLPECLLAVSSYETISLQNNEAHEITSPNYPDDYRNNEDKLWKIVAPVGYSVRLHFTDFKTERWGDYVIIYNDTSGTFDESTERVRFSGNSLPRNITSIYSYMWIRFRSNSGKQYQGFRGLADVVTPDWTCEFYTDTCGLTIEEGTWAAYYSGNQYFAQAFSLRDLGDVARFTVPHEFTSSEGTLRFAHYSTNYGSLSVAVCKSQQSTSYGDTNVRVINECIQYSCNGTHDVEISFTATRESHNSRITVDYIQLYETSVSSTVSSVEMMAPLQCPVIYDPATTSASDRNFSDSPYWHEVTMATTPQPSRGVLNLAAIPAVSSVFVGLVIGLAF